MSTFESVREAREAGFMVCRIDNDGILVRRPTNFGELFGWVPRPARFVYGARKETLEEKLDAVEPQRRAAPSTFWFPPL